MSYLEAIILGAIEGVTEFLPISSTGHLTIAEKLLGFEIDAALLDGDGFGPVETAFVCGSNGFVETAAQLLVGSGIAPERVRTERFGPTGVS